jgi:trypsin
MAVPRRIDGANSRCVIYATASIINHPNYNARTLHNDVAIIRTSNNIVFSNVITAGSITGINYNLGDNQVVWDAGWGAISVSIYSSSLKIVKSANVLSHP